MLFSHILFVLFYCFGALSASEEYNGVEELVCPLNYNFVTRKEWSALPSGDVITLQTPVPYVIIAHTVTRNCSKEESCINIMQAMQTYHMESAHWSDIAYNFVVGGDGSVYEGRGWDVVGTVAKRQNSNSISIGMIGDFSTILPPRRQLVTLSRLIEKGVRLGKIHRDYKLLGHRQAMNTISPGDALFAEIQHWPHSVPSINGCF